MKDFTPPQTLKIHMDELRAAYLPGSGRTYINPETLRKIALEYRNDMCSYANGVDIYCQFTGRRLYRFNF